MGKTEVPTMTIRYDGLFDFDELYAAIVDWAKGYNYIWHEPTYKHKVPSKKGAEQEYKWVMVKKVTDYIRYHIKLEVHVWDLKEIEVKDQGKVKILSNAHLYINMSGSVEHDWQKRFGKKKIFGQNMGELYFKLVGQGKSAEHFDILYYRMLNLQALIKKYFNMQTKGHAYKGYLGEN